MSKNDILNKYENFQAYWDLINNIDALCEEAIDSGLLYGDDIISALDRVKTAKTVEHIEYRFNLETDLEEDDNEGEGWKEGQNE